MSDSEQDRDDDQQVPAPESAPLWKHPGLAVVAALVALVGLVWRCA